MKKLVVLLCAAGLLLTACKEEIKSNDPTIFSISPKSTNISAVSQSMEYDVECDKAWTASMALGLWTSLKSSNETGKIVVSALLNDSADTRSDTLIVRSGSKSLKVPFVQKGLNSILSTTALTLVGMEPGTITVNASADWTATITGTIDASWITMDRSSGSKGESTIKFQANAENYNIGDRNVLIKFEMGGDIFYATVTQKQTDAILKDRDKVELSNGAQNFSLTLQHNVEYSVSIDCDWIEKVETKALNTSTETFSVTANSKDEVREGSITFSGNGVSETVRVFQAECDVLAFVSGFPIAGGETDMDTRDLFIPSDGSHYEVELRSNIEYDIIWPEVDWLKPASSTGNAKLCAVRNDMIAFDVDSNKSLEVRTCRIIIKDHNSDLCAALQIQQDGIVPEYLDEEEYGIYDANSGALFTYTPKVDQIAVYKEQGTVSFRIQNPETGSYMVISGMPEKADGPFDVTVKHNMSLGFPQEEKHNGVVIAKTENRKVWLYCEDGTGFIVKM